MRKCPPMPNIFGDLDRDPGPGARLDVHREVSPLLLCNLHDDFVRGKRREFIGSLPFLLLAVVVWVAAVRHPGELGGLALFSFVAVVRIGRVGHEWWTLRRADAVALRAHEEREGQRRRSDLIEFEARVAQVWPVVGITLTAVV